MDTDAPGESPDELERLAEDWIALWQSEVAALGADRELAEGWVAFAAQWAALASSWMRGATPPGMPQGGAFPPFPTAPAGMPWPFPPSGFPPGWPAAAHDPAPPRPAPAADASEPGHGARPGGDDGDALRQRLEQLERRLADLEGGAGGEPADRRRPGRRPPRA